MAEGVSNTQFFKVEVEPVDSVRTILEEVYYCWSVTKGVNSCFQGWSGSGRQNYGRLKWSMS